MTVRRTFWILSIANWLLAVAVWSVSAYLGIARPTSLFIPTTLFVIGIFAVLAGTFCWVVARFGKPPEAAEAREDEVTETEVTEAELTAAEAITAAPAGAAAAPAGASAPGEPASAAEQALPAEAG